MNHTLATDWLRKLLYLLPLAGLALAVANIWVPYSYWFDELYSVTESQQDLAGMFDILLTDVHPPLYQLLLWVWMRLFGDTEPASRAMSLMFALASLATLTWWARRQSHWLRIGTLIFFATSMLFPYYAQETRSYAMLLCLSTLLTITFLDQDDDRKRFITLLVIGLLLSLTHYFGLLVTSVVYSWLFIANLRKPKRTLLLLLASALALAWPIFQAHYGTLMEKTGGHFWIQIDGPFDTIKTALKSATSMTWVWLVIAAIALSIKQVRSGYKPHLNNLVKLTFLVTGTIFLAVLIDLHTPVSTNRNFIVLLPAFAILFGIGINMLFRQRYTTVIAVLLLVMVGYGNLRKDYKSMHNKWAPEQNWKEAASYLASHAEPDMAFYFLPFEDTLYPSRIYELMNSYYISRQLGRPVMLNKINVAGIRNIATPYAILFGHFEPGVIAQRITDYHYTDLVVVHYPIQSLQQSTGVIHSRPSRPDNINARK